jgi:hypothetical protein
MQSFPAGFQEELVDSELEFRSVLQAFAQGRLLVWEGVAA